MTTEKQNLNIRSQKRELQGPTKLNTSSNHTTQYQRLQATIIGWDRNTRRTRWTIRNPIWTLKVVIDRIVRLIYTNQFNFSLPQILVGNADRYRIHYHQKTTNNYNKLDWFFINNRYYQSRDFRWDLTQWFQNDVRRFDFKFLWSQMSLLERERERVAEEDQMWGVDSGRVWRYQFFIVFGYFRTLLTILLWQRWTLKERVFEFSIDSFYAHNNQTKAMMVHQVLNHNRWIKRCLKRLCYEALIETFFFTKEPWRHSVTDTQKRWSRVQGSWRAAGLKPTTSFFSLFPKTLFGT